MKALERIRTKLNRNTRLHLRFNDQLIKQITEVAKKENCSRIDLIECVMRDFLELYDVSPKSNEIPDSARARDLESCVEGQLTQLFNDQDSASNGCSSDGASESKDE